MNKIYSNHERLKSTDDFSQALKIGESLDVYHECKVTLREKEVNWECPRCVKQTKRPA